MQKILIVDDSADIRLLLGRTLKAAGYTTCEASDGEEVLAAILSYEPDLVLLDVAMPKVDGFKALAQIKKDARTKHLPVVMVTAKGHPDDLDTARALGAADYVNKPWSHGEVELRVQWALGAAQRAKNPKVKRAS